MAQKLFINEFSGLPPVMGHPAAIAELPPIASQVVTLAGAGTSAQSTAFQPNTRVIRVALDSGSTTGACIKVAAGTSATATTNDLRVAPNQTEYFYVNGGITSEALAVMLGTF